MPSQDARTSIEAIATRPLMIKFDPTYSTSTTADLTDSTRGKADGEWGVRHLAAGQEAGPFHRVQEAGEWEPKRDTPERRWAGTTMSGSKADAVALYHLDHLDIANPWHVFTFMICAGQPCEYFISRVKNGRGTQIKIPNQTCAFVQIKDKSILIG